MKPLNNEATGFFTIALADLFTSTREELDALSFGVVGLSPKGMVEIYNATESRMAGLPFETVFETDFFSTTAQCMNNFMVAQRFVDEPELDVVIDYVLTLRMRPTPVRLRLLKNPSIPRHYLLIHRGLNVV